MRHRFHHGDIAFVHPVRTRLMLAGAIFLPLWFWRTMTTLLSDGLFAGFVAVVLFVMGLVLTGSIALDDLRPAHLKAPFKE
ncbi:hypothetical protein AYR46_20120 [Sphingobium yanoikuyae]|uniref:hypothetical protein n=1 Tax=Sphingobium yanoikuyae TaxID=13690 RepID=UPI0007A73863|nr:hypothetical protein [Sphingobium yanoikuyae]KZC75980.1 hypothetical protein AYR46_20120 [Sphingobium yanoikuyae]